MNIQSKYANKYIEIIEQAVKAAKFDDDKRVIATLENRECIIICEGRLFSTREGNLACHAYTHEYGVAHYSSVMPVVEIFISTKGITEKMIYKNGKVVVTEEELRNITKQWKTTDNRVL